MPRIAKECIIHFENVNTSSIKNSTKASLDRILKCSQDWSDIKGEHIQKNVAQNFIATFPTFPSSADDLYFHRECYQRFTDQGNVQRIISKQIKYEEEMEAATLVSKGF